MRKQVFSSLVEAQAAYDADAAAHSITGYPAGDGWEASYTVYFDDDALHDVAQGAKVLSAPELFAPLLKVYAEELESDEPRFKNFGYPVLKDGEG